MKMKDAIKGIVAAVLVFGTGIVGGTPDFVIVSPPDLRAAWEVYAVLASSRALPACWAGRFTTPGGQPVELVLAVDRTILCVRVRRVGTVLLLR